MGNKQDYVETRARFAGEKRTIESGVYGALEGFYWEARLDHGPGVYLAPTHDEVESVRTHYYPETPLKGLTVEPCRATIHVSRQGVAPILATRHSVRPFLFAYEETGHPHSIVDEMYSPEARETVGWSIFNKAKELFGKNLNAKWSREAILGQIATDRELNERAVRINREIDSWVSMTLPDTIMDAKRTIAAIMRTYDGLEIADLLHNSEYDLPESAIGTQGNTLTVRQSTFVNNPVVTP